jgi:hypothetical protein
MTLTSRQLFRNQLIYIMFLNIDIYPLLIQTNRCSVSFKYFTPFYGKILQLFSLHEFLERENLFDLFVN